MKQTHQEAHQQPYICTVRIHDEEERYEGEEEEEGDIEIMLCLTENKQSKITNTQIHDTKHIHKNKWNNITKKNERTP